MKRAYLAGAVGIALAGLFASLSSCGSEDDTKPPGVTTDSGTTDSNTTTDGDTGTPDDSGDVGGDGAVPCPTTPTEGKIAELTDPTSSKKVDLGKGVKLTGVIATSPKFRVDSSTTAGGTCLYGLFVADANATYLPYSGILVVSKGNPAVAGDGGKGFCPSPTGSIIPDDVKIGDQIDLVGTYTEYGVAATSCGKATPPLPPPSPAKQRQIASTCVFTVKGAGTPVAPADVTAANIEDGSADLPKWMGGLVRIKDVTADSDLSYGAFKVAGSKLEVADNIYYRGAATAPKVVKGDKFTQITGISYLDFCTWSLEPRNICDHTPIPGDGSKCGGAPADAGTDSATDTKTD